MKEITILKNEIKSTYGWYFGWFLGLTIYNLLLILMYPGEEGVKAMVDFLEKPAFQAFFGIIGGDSPGFILWISMMIQFHVIILLIVSFMGGARIATISIANGTGEITHSLPIYRISFLLIRFIASIILQSIILLGIFLPLAFPISDGTVPISRLITIFWLGLMFMAMGTSIGISLGLIIGSPDKGQQNGLLLVLFFYSMQVLSRLKSLEFINEVNILSWFDPATVLLFDTVNDTVIKKMIFTLIIFLVISIYLFQQMDLMKESGLKILRIRDLFQKEKETTTNHVRQKTKSNKNSIFLIWVRPIEKHFPITADFIYSERRVLLIIFWAVIMIYPLQLMTYLGDADTLELMTAFGSNAMFRLTTYNIDLQDQPYFWFLATQSIGGHWFVFIPLMLYWVKKILRSDGENKTGEILGSLPISKQRVLMQRLLAVLLEMIWISTLMVFFLILSELYINQSVNLLWEIIAIFSQVLLYYSMISTVVFIGLQSKYRGIIFARSILYISLILFFIGLTIDKYQGIEFIGLMGFYNPIAIINQQSIFVANDGLIVLTVLSIISTILVRISSNRFEWLDAKKPSSSHIHLN